MPEDANVSTSSSSTGEDVAVAQNVTYSSSNGLSKTPPIEPLSSSFDQRDLLSTSSTPPADVNILGDFSSLPIIAHFIFLVVTVNVYLCRLLPFYATIITVATYVVQTINRRVENLAIFRWVVLICRRTFRAFIEQVRRFFPSVAIPPQEMLDRMWHALSTRIYSMAVSLSAYPWSQRALRTLETVLRHAETFVRAVTFDNAKRSGPLWVVPNRLLNLYQRTIGSVMESAADRIHHLGTVIRNCRRSGGRIIVQNAQIRNRRKASPRKGTRTEPTSTARSSLSYLMHQILLRLGLAGVKAQLSLDARGDQNSPNKPIPSEEKKRKLSDIEERSNTEEMTYNDLMGDDLPSEGSEEDPDFEPSTETTGSSVNRTSDDYYDEEELLLPNGVDVELPHPSSSSPNLSSASSKDHRNIPDRKKGKRKGKAIDQNGLGAVETEAKASKTDNPSLEKKTSKNTDSSEDPKAAEDAEGKAPEGEPKKDDKKGKGSDKKEKLSPEDKKKK